MDVSPTPKLFHNHQLIVNPLNQIASLVLGEIIFGLANGSCIAAASTGLYRMESFGIYL